MRPEPHHSDRRGPCPKVGGCLAARAAVLFLLVSAHAARADDVDARARALHRDAIVVDGHNDVTMFMIDYGFDLDMDGSKGRSPWLWFFAPWLPGRPEAEGLHTDTDLTRLLEGGVDAQFFSVWVSPDYYDPEDPSVARERALAQIEILRGQARRSPRLELATNVEDIRRIAAAGHVAALMGVEGGHAIAEDLDTLRRFHDLGVRYMTLTWSFSHSWADSSGDDGLHGGLTDFGRDVVREMNRIGMVVDVSHVSDETFWDTLEVARAPVIASHSSARALVEHPRNMDDDMIRAVAKNDGVVMVNFGGIFLDPRKSSNRKIAINTVAHGFRLPTTVDMLADHVEHVARVAGVDHVGLGSDYDGTLFLPREMPDVAGFPNLTVELARRGWSDTDLRKVLGENVLRVLSQVETQASR